MTKRTRTRGDRACDWIEAYCVRRGQPIQLGIAEVVLLRRYYDEGERPQFDATLSACIALLHLCGIEHDAPSLVEADVFSIMNAAGPNLSAHIKRDGGSVVCPELGTRVPNRGA
jgi:hypothetical protein